MGFTDELDDAVTWLRRQLDADEREATHCVDLYEQGPHEQMLRTVAAHRAILDRYRAQKSYADRPYDEPRSPAKNMTLALANVVREIAKIYSDRPGYDPAWTLDP